MASGTPVVCTTAASLPEVAGDAAQLVPPNRPQALGEAIESILKNENLAATLREKGLLRAATFTWERTAQATLAIYQALAH